ncbi:unnamed protein product [Parajaminaea phylloscopi]
MDSTQLAELVASIQALATNTEPQATTLLTTLVGSLANGPKTNSKRQAKPSEPTKFSGSKKSNEAVQAFLANLDIYFTFYSTRNDFEKISIAQSYFEPNDIAAQWIRPYLKYLDPDSAIADKRPAWLSSWTAFGQELERRFGDPLDFDTAVQRLATLRQTKSVSQFAVTFQSIAARTSFDEATQIALFRNGLQKHIAMAISAQEFSSLNDLIATAIRTDDIQHHHDDIDRKKPQVAPSRVSNNISTFKPRFSAPSVVTTRSTTTAPVPMDIDTMPQQGDLVFSPVGSNSSTDSQGLDSFLSYPIHVGFSSSFWLGSVSTPQSSLSQSLIPRIPPLQEPGVGSQHFVAVKIHLPNGTFKDTVALVDNGAESDLINTEFAQSLDLPLQALQRPRQYFGWSGKDKSPPATHFLDLTFSIADHVEKHLFTLADSHQPIILGQPWLTRHDPSLGFRRRTLAFTSSYCSRMCLPTKHHTPALPLVPATSITSGWPATKAANNSSSKSSSRFNVVKTTDKSSSKPSVQFSPVETASNYLDSSSKVPPLSSPKFSSKETAQVADISLELPSPRPAKQRRHQARRLAKATSIQVSAASLALTEDDEAPMFPSPPDSQEYLDKLKALVPSEFHDLLAAFSPSLADASATHSNKSPAGAPVLFVKKKSGELRLCVDYRALNSITKKNRCALPLIGDALDQVSGSKVFTKLDLRGAYNLVRIKEGDEWKTAFRTHLGHYESVVMPFGLTNAPATFQTIMNDIFRDLIDVHVQVYLDDILIHTPDQVTNVKITREVLRRLADNRLYCKAEKCEFFSSSTEYLGFRISSEGISMLPDRVDAVLKWPTPTSLTELQSFLGFGNYSRRCIKGYSKLAKPLTSLTRNDNKPFKFPPEAIDAFERLKLAFTSAPVLVHFDATRETRVEPDASLYACGAVLAQRNPATKIWHPVAYHSRSFSPAELNYTVGDKELTAILDALETWRHYLIGLPEFDILTDHRNLAYFLAPQKDLKERHHRAQLRLSRFHFHLKYRPGDQNGLADALSRRSDLMKEGVSAKARQVATVLKPISVSSVTRSRSRLAESTDSSPSSRPCFDADFRTGYLQALAQDADLSAIAANLPAHPSYQLLDQVLVLNGRIAIPKSEPLRTKLLAQAHDSPLSGHPGREKTFDLVSRQYTWPTLRQDVANFVAECPVCQRTKPTRRKPAGLLRPLPIPDRPWSSISMDHITALPSSKGHNAILVIVDRFSKMAHFIPARTTDTALDLASQFVNEIVRLHGFPNDIVSDRGTTFTSQFWREVLKQTNVSPMFSTAFHPQTNGQTERINQILEQYLRVYTNHLQDDWRQLLALAEFAYNNSTSSSTKQTPFFTCYGYHPNAEFTITDSAVPASRDLVSRLQQVHDSARANLALAQAKYAKYADIHRRESPVYQVGQLVKLSRRNIPSGRPTDKLNDRWIGPLKIIEVVNPVAVRLELPTSMKIHPVFHVNLLELWTPTSNAFPRTKSLLLHLPTSSTVKRTMKSKKSSTPVSIDDNFNTLSPGLVTTAQRIHGSPPPSFMSTIPSSFSTMPSIPTDSSCQEPALKPPTPRPCSPIPSTPRTPIILDLALDLVPDLALDLNLALCCPSPEYHSSP